MKFDDHLAAYLYQYKSLELEGIGIFTLDGKVRVPNEHEKEVVYPIEGLSFTYNPKSRTEENIISFLVKKLHKIEPLIRSDIEYYLSNIRVLLNIGKPYSIEGIGTLNKNNQGIYEFTPGNFLPAKETVNPKRKNTSHNYPPKSTFSAGRFFVIILIIISALAAIGGIGWGILNFTAKQLTSNEGSQAASNESYETAPQIDTILQEKITIAQERNPIIQEQDTATPNTITAPVSLPLAPARDSIKPVDSMGYKMIFEITKSKERAHSRTAQLHSLHSYTQYDSIPINDSVAYYRLFLIMKVAPADTTRVKDSLKTILGSRIFMQKQNQD